MIAGVPVSRSCASAPAGARGPGTGQHRSWIVKLPTNWSDERLAEFVQDAHEVGFCGHPSENGLPMLVVFGTEEDLTTFLEQPEHDGIEYVEEDGQTSFEDPLGELEQREPSLAQRSLRAAAQLHEDSATQGAVSEPEQASPPSWGLDRIDQEDLPLDELYRWRSPSGGSGVHVYVFDTGIRTTHQDFGGRAIPTLDAVKAFPPKECQEDLDDLSCAQDVNGHGTHCAGTVGGITFGVAKSVTLHGVKVLGDGGSGWWSWFLAALDWVLADGLRPAVVSASMGGAGSSQSVKDAVDRAVAAGVTVVTSAGNQASDACGYQPANVASAITVGSTTSSDSRSSFSNNGACVDIFAPGSAIVSAGVASDSANATYWGTSMACPHVSGVAALVLAEDGDRTLTPEGVAKVLTSQASIGKVKDAGPDTPNKLLYVPALSPTPAPPTNGSGICCYHGQGCQDEAKSCNEPGHYCSESEERCTDCGGLFFCNTSATPAPAPVTTPVPPTPAPAPTEPGACCYHGAGCQDENKSCNPREHFCSQSKARCTGCHGLFFCPSVQDSDPVPSPSPNSSTGACCYWGSGCQDAAKSCNPPTHWCSQSTERCSECHGLFFCTA